MSHRSLALTIVTALTLAVGATTNATGAPTPKAPQATSTRQATPTHPSAAHFTAGRVDNPWFPLRPGTRLVYRGIEDGNRLRDVVFVTHQTEVIDGITCRVVHDRLYENRTLRERTTDWYAQTRHGTVWYFGEQTAELDRNGHVVSREGSFKSGQDGAEAGIFMTSHPQAGQSFKQEDYPGHAEDRFTILDLDAHISVPMLGSDHALLTEETTVLEPGVLDHKYYVRDIGTVREVTVRGGNESLRLTSVSHIR